MFWFYPSFARRTPQPSGRGIQAKQQADDPANYRTGWSCQKKNYEADTKRGACFLLVYLPFTAWGSHYNSWGDNGQRLAKYLNRTIFIVVMAGGGDNGWYIPTSATAALTINMMSYIV